MKAGGDDQAGFFFLVVVGFNQCPYKSKVFFIASDKMDSDTELAGFISFAINDITFNLYLVFMQIEKHQGELFCFDFQEGFDLNSGLAHVANNRDILMDQTPA